MSEKIQCEFCVYLHFGFCARRKKSYIKIVYGWDPKLIAIHSKTKLHTYTYTHRQAPWTHNYIDAFICVLMVTHNNRGSAQSRIPKPKPRHFSLYYCVSNALMAADSSNRTYCQISHSKRDRHTPHTHTQSIVDFGL